MKITEDKIIESIQRRQAKNREFQVSRTIPNFLRGELVVVDVSKNGEPLGENYVYINSFGELAATFLSMDELATWISNDKSRLRGSTKLTSFEAVSAIIAILITITICIVVFFNLSRGGSESVEVPGILANALTTILGFYFGSQVKKSQTSEEPMAKEVTKMPLP